MYHTDFGCTTKFHFKKFKDDAKSLCVFAFPDALRMWQFFRHIFPETLCCHCTGWRNSCGDFKTKVPKTLDFAISSELKKCKFHFLPTYFRSSPIPQNYSPLVEPTCKRVFSLYETAAVSHTMKPGTPYCCVSLSKNFNCQIALANVD